MPTRIVFSGGHEIVVATDGETVSAALEKARRGSEAFARFDLLSRDGERPVFVAPEQVAYVEPRETD